MNSYWRNLGIALDQGLNTILGGQPDETLSSRAYRTELKKRVLGTIFRPIIDTLFWFEPNHCKDAFFAERKRAQLPPEFREEKE
jgi:hypothetical protein